MSEQQIKNEQSHLLWKKYWHYPVLIGVSLLIFWITFMSPVNSGGADAHFSMIVSQSLLENHTFYVEDYKEAIPDQFQIYNSFQLREWNGHLYYRYPLGTSIFATPFVWTVRQFTDKDMLNTADNHQTQNLISSFTVVSVFLLIYALGRSYVDRISSLIITLIFTFGTTLISTMGSAFWNVNLLVMLELMVLWLIIRYKTGTTQRFYFVVLGLLLFTAFFTRPTAAIFIVAILIYLFIKYRTAFWITAITAGSCLFAFLVFSQVSYGEPLPPYYAAGSWITPENLFVALFGVLVSPSRGIFIYSSFLLLLGAGSLYYFQELKRIGLFWVSIIWFALLVLLVASTRNWWGGYSFGPRLLTDGLPALVLLTILIWKIMRETASIRVQYGTMAVFLLLGFSSVFIHSYLGLFNEQTLAWNGSLPPSVDRHPEYIFNLKYPQILASKEMICERNLEYIQDIVQTGTPLIIYEWGSPISVNADQHFNIHGDTDAQRREKELRLARGEIIEKEIIPNHALFAGWSPPHDKKRNSVCELSTILLMMGDVNTEKEYQLSLAAITHTGTVVDLFVNSEFVGTTTFMETEGNVETAVFELPSTVLQANQLNEIQFYFPPPQIRPEQRGYNIGLIELQFEENL